MRAQNTDITVQKNRAICALIRVIRGYWVGSFTFLIFNFSFYIPDMILSRYNLKNIQSPDLQVPSDSVFDLPEKVLQFGTGVLLRGLPDYFIDKANRNGIFNGRVVVVKSTDGGDASAPANHNRVLLW